MNLCKIQSRDVEVVMRISSMFPFPAIISSDALLNFHQHNSLSIVKQVLNLRWTQI